MSQMTTDAKKALSTTIRGLRERLLTDLNASLDRTYLLAVPTPVSYTHLTLPTTPYV